MATKTRSESWNRRQFVAGVAALGASSLLTAQTVSGPDKPEAARDVFIVPNFHPASCGWLTTFSKERVYCANSYLDHLDRVRDDGQYNFVMSEVNNIIAIMNFKPQRIPELKQRIQQGRVELVNGFYLESTINLTGGEALVRMGSAGLGWYENMFGVRPRYAWCIDTCGVHDQMAQIVTGLGLEALIYTRNNPTGETIFWTESPDGSRTLTLCPGSYHEARSVFDSKTPFDDAAMSKLQSEFESKEKITPKGAPLLILGGGADYSLAPKVHAYPSALIKDFSRATENKRKLQFTTLSKYLDVTLPGIRAGEISLMTHKAGTSYVYDSFWIENPEVKTRYRESEHALHATEALATIASLTGSYVYPAQRLYEAWTLMFLNADRNTLWGSAGGMVFVSEASWDVRDRFQWVADAAAKIRQDAAPAANASEGEIAIFNPCNWHRSDPVVISLPPGTSIAGVACEASPDGTVAAQLPIDGMSLRRLKVKKHAPQTPQRLSEHSVVETRFYVLRMNQATGSISSLRFKKTGRELIGGSANLIVAERPKQRRADHPPDPGDLMPPIPENQQISTSDAGSTHIEARRGPLSTTIVSTSTFYGGGVLERTVRIYDAHPRIDFEVELNDIPNNTVVFSSFAFAEEINEVRRGVPFGFSHAAWAKPNGDLHGWAKGIVPAIRWSDYQFAGGGGVAILDRGLSGRELDGRTASIYLINAEDKYHGYDNPWLSGKGKHLLQFALLPHEENWREARLPQAAWEYNSPLSVFSPAPALEARAFLKTSDNIIVESFHRKDDQIVLRFVEAFGLEGEAIINLALPHTDAVLTNLVGKTLEPLHGGPEYRIALRPQQIVTIHFSTTSPVAEETIITDWAKFVPAHKLVALNAYDPNLIGHPPFGD